MFLSQVGPEVMFCGDASPASQAWLVQNLLPLQTGSKQDIPKELWCHDRLYGKIKDSLYIL